ncbi:aldehyde ferredoxin oxidoreductase N-terminal domain-containing protein [Chloroflexota bacterium]
MGYNCHNTMYGYTGSILICDLSEQTSSVIPTSEYSRNFLGGRGIAARLYWEMVPPHIKALDPTNPLIIMTGPLAGFSGLSGSRWQICAKSPALAPESFSYSNLGGAWGASMKFAGFDGLVIRGAAEKPVYLFINDGVCEYRDATELWGLGAAEARDKLSANLGNDAKALVTGPAGENRVPFATLLSEYDASASGGFGAVMGSKNLKAIIVSGSQGLTAANPRKLEELTKLLRQWKRQELQTPPAIPQGMKAKIKACSGCTAGCSRSLLRGSDGKQGKYLCTAGFFYEDWAQKYYGELTDVPFKTSRLCDDYGLDVNVVYTMIPWLSRCYQEGIISEETTGLPLSRIGSLEFITELLRITTRRENFGELLAMGVFRAAQEIGNDALKLIPDYVFHDGSYTAYDPRIYLANAMVLACEPRQSFPLSGDTGRTVLRWLDWVGNNTYGKNQDSPSHVPAGREVNDKDLLFIAKHFWGSEEAADFTTTAGKALAAKMIQDRHYVKESLILCNFSWHITSIEILRPHIIAEILSAVTGKQYDERSIYSLGERIFNLQRAIHLRDWDGKREIDTLPEVWYHEPVKEAFMNPGMLIRGKDGKPISREGSILDKSQFESMKKEYYQLRGWHLTTGLPKESKLAEIGLKDIGEELKKSGLTQL